LIDPCAELAAGVDGEGEFETSDPRREPVRVVRIGHEKFVKIETSLVELERKHLCRIVGVAVDFAQVEGGQPVVSCFFGSGRGRLGSLVGCPNHWVIGQRRGDCLIDGEFGGADSGGRQDRKQDCEGD